MPREEDHTTVYDAAWNVLAKLETRPVREGVAEVLSGPVELLERGVLYRASVDGRYYGCVVVSGPSGPALRLNALAHRPAAEASV